MTIVTGGIIRHLSVSQAERFDPAQNGGCPRWWWFEAVEGIRPEQHVEHTDGEKGHELLAAYLTEGQLPGKRVKMGKAVTGAIAAGHLPKPAPDLLVERRFDGQPKHGPAGEWLQLDTARTFWLGGLPWDGFVDLRFYREGVVSVWDHKFSSDIHQYAKPADKLLSTVQMPVYALDSLRLWPEARAFELVHHYVSRRGVESFVRRQRVSLEHIHERRDAITVLVEEMKRVALATSQEDVPFNRRACSAWRGCPHQSICSAFRRNTLALTPEELALFGDFEPEKPLSRYAEALASGAAVDAGAESDALARIADAASRTAELIAAQR
jgi:hypothetical protein